LLAELGHEVIVANARKVRLIGESRRKEEKTRKMIGRMRRRWRGSIRSCCIGAECFSYGVGAFWSVVEL